VRNWAKFLGFKLNQERAEYVTKKNMRYNMVWSCKVSNCTFVVRFAREKDSFYIYEKSYIHHNHEISQNDRVKKTSSPKEIDSQMKEFIEFNATKLKSKSEIASLLNQKFGTSFENKQSYYLMEKIKSLDFELKYTGKIFMFYSFKNII